MPFRFTHYLILFTLGFAIPAQASLSVSTALSEKIHAMIDEKFNTQRVPTDNINVEILASSRQLDNLCHNPELSFSGQTHKVTGNRTVIARCGSKRHYIRIRTSVIGTYWVANQVLQPGQPITLSQLTPRKGHLDNLPANIIFDPQHIIEKTSTRLIKPDQPFTTTLLREQWSVLAGEEVSIVAIGSGYQVLTVGKSLDNAALNEPLRFRTRSGQILSGKAIGKQKVTIIMQN
ncbi:flagellar basal body P-ring formation chaperone FlgA [Serratia fonticola]|uniref:flagellar basal body P-ring formation chaperone FlgA n=1 Tax=Serratia fonticola TaxID=47917 RepID=UPI0004669E75|nr:flagellar basal body P-ring formation chaperone FlgA [Serratia fonticola]